MSSNEPFKRYNICIAFSLAVRRQECSPIFLLRSDLFFLEIKIFVVFEKPKEKTKPRECIFLEHRIKAGNHIHSFIRNERTCDLFAGYLWHLDKSEFMWYGYHFPCMKVFHFFFVGKFKLPLDADNRDIYDFVRSKVRCVW